MDLVPYAGSSLKDISQQPHHITHEQYKELREAIKTYYEECYTTTGNISLRTERRVFIEDRDLLLIDYLWETGGRVGDIVNVRFTDYQGRTLHLFNKKRKKTVKIPIDEKTSLYQDTVAFIRKYYIKDNARIFPISTSNVRNRMKKYGLRAGIKDLHPHMFRHGIALHLLNQGVPIPVISARLGHANVFVTMQQYMRITPELQKQHLSGVVWR